MTDRTAKARLRDAAIELVAEGATLTARTVAERAGVTAGLIRHHFGSMADLERACDEHIARLVRVAKEDAVEEGASVDVLQAIRESGETHMLRYLARRVAVSSAVIDDLVDQMADDAAGYMQSSVDAGLMNHLSDVPRAAKMLTVYALGSLVLHDHVRRLIDVDVTTVDLTSEPGIADYIGVQYDIFSGLFNHAALETLQDPTKE